MTFEFIGTENTMEKTVESVRRGGKVVIVGHTKVDFKISSLPPETIYTGFW